ncbi:hypothetical protein A3B51_02795 [Candidatus Curtissbacteria bacterium RIFCSPLOWO2_01_FULL_41_18]|uniref:Uncharacterized protein n=2 Tax=Candidatus Curtissiibacteriota TaxID=1752717 RepID=A0A1F5G113_9BACT|nr:MAG: hypothetical protein A2696_00705 [Candidatus Curtissbacteria bacterium RIFCSPHIGHO2_01_FULL_41_13]OGE05427.1 MAG: hypothetical protein A3B51_02795 [Candidatus Curtissbacteria bacterium RIFCSPLOWO2_01_FULL_41_18]
MIKIINSKATEQTLKEAAEDLEGYIKVVVDVSKEILAAGGERHVDGEQLLIKEGSKQQDLWGGGLDLETNEIDFDSMINIRPAQNNPSREVLDPQIRTKMQKLIRKLLR